MTTHPEASIDRATPSYSRHLLLVERLGLVVEGRALLDRAEALDVQCLPCCGDCGDPGALLALGRQLLGDNLAGLVLDEVALAKSGLGLGGLACEDVAFGQACGDLLHGLHCLHGLHGLHGSHVFATNTDATNIVQQCTTSNKTCVKLELLTT